MSRSSRSKAKKKPAATSRWSRRRLWTMGITLLVAVALAAAWHWLQWLSVRRLWEAPSSGRCTRRLDRPTLDRSLALGAGYLLRHQKPDGNFDYQYDWKQQTTSSEDNQVRQAGALWGIALLYQDRPTPELKAGLERGLAFFDRHSVEAPGGRRCVAYPGESIGETGTVALVALAGVESLRAAERSQADESYRASRARLDQYLAHLTQARSQSGLWHGQYSLTSCQSSGASSPYADGEALLALVKAAKYLGRRDLEPLIRRAAEAGYRFNVEQALATDRDSDTTKGYYQWSSMAFYELFTSGWPDTAQYGDWITRLADWMVDVHKILWRTRNTAYAYEGIIHAYQVARLRGDQARMAKYGCVVDAGLEKLTSWQIGSPIAVRELRGKAEQDPLALGGIQNQAFDAGLRIDVVQHQMHAVTLARRYVYTP